MLISVRCMCTAVDGKNASVFQILSESGSVSKDKVVFQRF